MTRIFSQLVRDRRASSAAEFALVLPLLILFLFGIIDVGRLMWTWNQAEKATQMGARYAVATEPVATGISTYSFATGGAGIPQGDAVGASYFSSMTCNSSTCNPADAPCVGSVCASLTTPYNSAAFTNIVDRMKAFFPQIGAANVLVEYRNSGLGYAGDPNGADIAPVVTVSIRNLVFQPITLAAFRTSITLPSFSAALTMEDGQGTVSN